MKSYSDKITFTKNSRGIYSLDTIIGCSGGAQYGGNGCFDDCYAASIAKRYGYDFSNFVRRSFKSLKHTEQIVKKINSIDMPFVRIGTMGDPSDDWEHTLFILEKLKGIEKQIVIITRHWTKLTQEQLDRLFTLSVTVNTSVSALDDLYLMDNCVLEHERLKPFCNSVLRVITCDFNLTNPEGFRMNEVQKKLISIDKKYIDTVFRPSKKNSLVVEGIINTKEMKFLKKKILASKLNKKTFFGKCAKCPEMCGAR
jgi:hypothetical protein